MKKVLIISYYFSPNELTASNRVLGFGKYLKKFGYAPIIITRDWSEALTKSSKKKIRHVYHDDYEVYYMPFLGSLRDRFKNKYGDRFLLLRKLLSFKELLLENFGLQYISYSNIYDKSVELIKNEDITHVLISANPFHQFYFGYLLKKDFPYLKWVADYRDEWTSRTLVQQKNIIEKYILSLQKKRERKWLEKADHIIGVSKYISKNIAKHVSCLNYSTVENGFFEEDYIDIETIRNDSSFVISYTGEIYEKQNFKIFCEAIKKTIRLYKDKIFIVFQLIGLENKPVQKKVIMNLMKGFEGHINFTKRLSRKECIALENSSNLLLMVAYGDLKGIPSSKLYQYIGTKKTIFLCPSDDDIIESILKETKLGVIANDIESAVIKLKELIDSFLSGKDIRRFNSNIIQQYSRRNQTKKLAKILDTL